MKKLLSFSIMLLVVLISSQVFAGADKQGYLLSVGGFSHIAPGADDEGVDFYSFKTGLYNQYNLPKKFYASWEINLSYLKWTGKSAEAVCLGTDLIFYKKLTRDLSIGLGGGFSTLNKTQDLPDLGNSGLYGTMTGRIKYKRVEVSVDHISDAIQDDDAGKNFIALTIYF